MMRTLLILAFMAQQLLLPIAGAQSAGHCQASAAAPNQPASCCAAPRQTDDRGDDQRIGCTCVPSLCACRGDHAPEPPAPERNQRSVDQLVPMLAMPSAAPAALLRAGQVIRPAEAEFGNPQHNRIQAVLCIWRT